MFPRSLFHALIWALVILGLCLMPPSNVPSHGWLEKIHADKMVHAVLFGVLFVLLAKGLRDQGMVPLLQARPLLSAFLLAVMYGIFTEWAQERFTTGRKAELGDVVADIAGVLLGMAYLRWGAAWMEQHRKRWERYF